MPRYDTETGERLPAGPARAPRYRGRPLTGPEIEEEIQRMMDLLDDAVETLEERAVEAAVAEAAYRKGHARALLESGRKTDAQRQAEAIHRSGDLLQRRLIAEALKEATAESCRARRAQLDALRTLAANARASEHGSG